MASSNQSASATPQLDTSQPAATPLNIYIVTFDAQVWSRGVSLLDGRPPINEHQGILGAYPTLSIAEDVAIKWALTQVQNYVCKDTSLKSEEDRKAAFQEWEGSESIQDNHWWYMLSKGAEGLLVKAEKVVLFDPYHYPGSSDRGRARRVGEQGNRV